jgi:hemerythrin-like domain-containing protein
MRHPAIVPLTHDHHHGLAQARRLRRAAKRAETAERMRSAQEFLAFFAAEMIAHFREEEEVLFPLLLGEDGEAPDVLVRILIEHVRIHAMVGALRDEVGAGDVSAGALAAPGEAIEAHIRLEERELFPLIERLVPEDRLGSIRLAPRTRRISGPASR